MNFDLSEEQTMLRDGVARFVSGRYSLECRRALAVSEAGFSREYWHQYAELGWLALNAPENAGGLGCSFVETTVLMEQFGRGLVLEPFVSSAVLCVRLIAGLAGEEQRQQLLPALACGKLMLALADSDAPGTAALAEPLENGRYRLSASKVMVIDGASADRFLVTATLCGRSALFLISADASGLERSSYALLNGFRAADLTMQKIEVDSGALIASGECVQSALAEALDHARLAYMSAAIGAMEACMETSADYLKQRSQFGQPLSQFQALRHVMAEMFVDTQQARSMLYFALSTLSQTDKRAWAVAAAKAIIGAAGVRVGAAGIQLHGGYGITDEYAVSHCYRYLFVLDRLYGSGSEHLARLEPRRD